MVKSPRRKKPMEVHAHLWQKRIEVWENSRRVMIVPNLSKARQYAQHKGYTGITVKFV